MTIKEKITSKEVHKKLSREAIDEGVVAFINSVNMQSGSAGSIDLYSLMKAYLLDEKKRDEINCIVKERM